MVDLGAFADLGLLELDEIADPRLLSEAGARPDPGERANAGFRADDCALDVAEGMDGRSVGDLHAWAEDDVRLDGHVAAELRVVGEPDAFRVDQGRALVEHLLAPSALPFELEVSEL